jgi:hypothetical protein
MTIAQLVNHFTELQGEANRAKEGTMDDDLLKGVLLSLCSTHKTFTRLTEDFSKISCKLTYREIISEMQEHEANTPHPVTGPTNTLEEALGAQIAASMQQTSTRTDIASHICNNYLQGRCAKPTRRSIRLAEGDPRKGRSSGATTAQIWAPTTPRTARQRRSPNG